MQKLKSFIIGITIFFIPIFFLPITHEFYNINKFMLLSGSVVALVTISTIQLIRTGRLRWSRNSVRLLIPVVAFLLSVFLSTMLRSENKIQSLMDLTFGPMMLSALTIFFWYVAEEQDITIVDILLRFGGAYVSVISLILMLHPFGSATLPRTFQFLKTNQFTPLGTQTDLLLFLGFISIYQLVSLVKMKKKNGNLNTFAMIGAMLSIAALSLSLVSLYSNSSTTKIPSTAPLGLSLRVASKTLRTPMNILFGVGINSFSSELTQVKDSSYNSTTFWSQPSFDNASSAVLKIFTESGIIGTLWFLGLFIFGFMLKKKTRSPILLIYSAAAVFLAPASLILFFILYLSLALSVGDTAQSHQKPARMISGLPYVAVSAVSAIALIGLWYVFWFFLAPTYRAEIAMRNSIDAISNNDLKELYDQQRKAVTLNPYIERYRLNFSQTNLFVAKQLASQQRPNQSMVTQSVQRAINEAQTAVSLNSTRASNWENLGVIYKNVLGVKGAEQWAIAAFQRAILLDPQNVSYRLELGGIFYSLKQYENAIGLFQQAILLKPDLPNAYYNLAYSYYQTNDVKRAVVAMDSLLSLLKKQSSSSYEKVLKERQGFTSGAPQKQAPSVLQ